MLDQKLCDVRRKGPHAQSDGESLRRSCSYHGSPRKILVLRGLHLFCFDDRLSVWHNWLTGLYFTFRKPLSEVLQTPFKVQLTSSKDDMFTAFQLLVHCAWVTLL